MEQITLTHDEIRAAFTEWDRRYREEPETFMNIVAHLLNETPASYGLACGPYFLSLIEDVREGGCTFPSPRTHGG